MSLLPRHGLGALIGERIGPCVSLFMPAHRAGADTQQDPIRFKNLLRAAEAHLGASGIRTTEAASLLHRPRALVDDAAFWANQSDGLAVFASPAMFRTYRLPLRFQELLVVGERFHVKPLLPLLAGDGRFYILALSQNAIRLFEATRSSVAELPLDVPQRLDDTLRPGQATSSLQAHSPMATGTTVFHGQGGGGEELKENLLRFFRRIDRGVQPVLLGDTAPLVLGGVDYLLPIYREASRYPHLLPQGIAGNPEVLRSEELHARAWALLEPHFAEARVRAEARYQGLAGTGRTARDPGEAATAAWQGRVQFLFVAVDAQCWGRLDRATGHVAVHETPEPGDEELLDLTAVGTFLRGGTV